MAVCGAACAAALPDIFLITVDTLRADHLGCYGYPVNTSPTIDALASRSLLFEDFVCDVPLTAPSFGAMFTSQYPRLNGNVRNGLPLPDRPAYLPELLHDVGYQTFCVQSNWTLKRDLSRMDRGFDEYDDSFSTKRWGIAVSERPGDDVVERALELLARRDPAKPLFFWIHFSDPHAPYKDHREFHRDTQRIPKNDRAAQTRARYDSEVAFTDDCIARVMEKLPRENAFVVFLADHGESLYEHGYVGHGRRIYHDNLRVPLLISGPGISPLRTKAPARGIDIAPTILGLLGMAPVQGMLGTDLIKAPPAHDRVRVVETYGGAVLRLPGARALMTSQPPGKIGVIVGPWKLIIDGSRTELFNLETDPGELKDLSRAEPDRVQHMRSFAEQFESTYPRRKEVKAELSNEDIEALKSQGYLD
jgi:choline-sulfatase